MSFQKIPTVETYQFYLDVAFSKGSKTADRVRSAVRREKVEKSRRIESARMDAVKDVLFSKLDNIVNEFPVLDAMSTFYKGLARLTINYDQYKKSLYNLSWASRKIRELHGVYNRQLQRANTIQEINKARKGYFGRVSSIMEKRDKDLKCLIECRKKIINYPVIKDLPTVCISGFPNVGKSTLLSKFTKSTPNIQSYAFTTKSLNLGYKTIRKQKVQFIDTPGTLARIDKMNSIEKQAELALKHSSDIIIYVWDVTEPYPMKEQIKLYNKIKKVGKPIVEYLSKTDIAPKKLIKIMKEKRPELNTTQTALRKRLNVEIAKLIIQKEEEHKNITFEEFESKKPKHS